MKRQGRGCPHTSGGLDGWATEPPGRDLRRLVSSCNAGREGGAAGRAKALRQRAVASLCRGAWRRQALQRSGAKASRESPPSETCTLQGSEQRRSTADRKGTPRLLCRGQRQDQIQEVTAIPSPRGSLVILSSPGQEGPF